MMAYLLLVQSSLCLLFFFISTTNQQESRHQVVELMMDEKRSVESPGFPDECCSPISYTIRFIGKENEAYIRLVFSDLDLEPGSNLLLYDGPDDMSPLFTYQPELYGRRNKGEDMLAWYREGIQSSGRHIHIKYIPHTSGFRSKAYTGFKANFYITESPIESWEQWPTSELCPYIHPSKHGGTLSLRPSHRYLKPAAASASAMLDCIWQVKPVPHAAHGAVVFARIEEITFGDKDETPGEQFSIEIRNTSASTGKLFFEYDRYSHDSSSHAGSVRVDETFMSGDGLYIRVKVPLDLRDYHVKLVYGFYLSPERCDPLTGWLCKPVDMCVAFDNMCDNIKQCSDSTDEINSKCISIATVELRRSITSTKAHNTPTNDMSLTQEDWYCQHGLKCPDGTCKYTWDSCDECPHYMRTCKNGECVDDTERCREDPCPAHRPFQCDGNQRCLFRSMVCDGNNECDDGQDEWSCKDTSGGLMSSLLWPTVLGITVPFILCTIPLAYFIHRSRKRGDTYRETVPTSSPDVGGEFAGTDHFPMNAGANMNFPS